MASPALELKAAFCGEKQRLISELMVAVADYVPLEARQLRAAVRAEKFGFDVAIKLAGERKNRAADGVDNHRRHHGC